MQRDQKPNLSRKKVDKIRLPATLSERSKNTFERIWQIMRGQLTRFGLIEDNEWREIKTKWIAALLASFVLSAFAAMVFLASTIPDVYRYAFPYPIPSADRSATLSILVARLERDIDGSQTRHVLNALRRGFNDSGKQGHVQVDVTQRTLQLDTSRELFHAHSEAETEGRRWLADSGFDVLIWGYVTEQNGVLQLYFLSNDSFAIGQGQHSIGFSLAGQDSNYELTNKLELPIDFNTDLGGVIAASAMVRFINSVAKIGLYGLSEQLLDELQQLYVRLNSIAQINISENRRLSCSIRQSSSQVGLILGEKTRSRQLLTDSVETLRVAIKDPACEHLHTALKSTLALGLISLGELTDDDALYYDAIAMLREVTEVTPKSSIALLAPQLFLGQSLRILGDRKNDSALLEQAVTVLTMALHYWEELESSKEWKDLSEKRQLLTGHQKAQVRLELGQALRLRGAQQKNRAFITQSISVFENALADSEAATRVWTTDVLPELANIYDRPAIARIRQNVAVQGLVIQSEIAVAYLALGTLDKDTAKVQRAVAIFEKIFNVWNSEYRMDDWAWAQNNYGLALKHLGEAYNDRPLFERAISAFEQALTGWDEHKEPQNWATAKNNLATISYSVGSRFGEPARLEKAASSFADLLRVWTRENFATKWATAQFGLGQSLRDLAYSNGQRTLLIRSLQAFQESIKERSKDRTPLEWAVGQANIATTLGMLGGEEAEPDRLAKAVIIFQDVLREFKKDDDVSNWAWIQMQSCIAHLSLGHRQGNRILFDQAASACELALDAFKSEKNLVRAAYTQFYLAQVYLELGWMEPDSSKLRSSLELLEQASNVYNAKDYPTWWIWPKVSAALAEIKIGLRENNVSSLEHATVALGQLLQTFRDTQKQFPQALLSDALSSLKIHFSYAICALSERTGRSDQLELALILSREASESISRKTKPVTWGAYQNIYGQVLRTRGVRETDEKNTLASLAILRESLVEQSRENEPRRWALTNQQLGISLRELAIRRADHRLLEESAAASRAALTFFEAAGAEYDIEQARGDLSKTELLLRQ